MTLNDLDPFYVKSVAALYSKDHLRTGDVSPLQKLVEEAIKAKSGKDKDLTAIVASCIIKQQNVEDFKNLSGTAEESKTASSSDNELELDLLKEDLMCVICNGMDVGARNRLLECSDCHSLYHQECHRPPVSQQEADNAWICLKCKDIKKVRKSPTLSRPTSPYSSGKSISKSTSSNHRSGSSSSVTSSSSYKTSSSSSKSVTQKSSSSSSSKPSTKPSSSSTSSSSSSARNMVTPNINIISADKRIQSMKKKAAKLQEKRKLPR